MSDLKSMMKLQARLHKKQGAESLGLLFDSALSEIETLEVRAEAAERELESRYKKWQKKYQLLKDSMRLFACYECGVPVHELSPRSRCCMCEYGRGEFNAKENAQLRQQLNGGGQ